MAFPAAGCRPLSVLVVDDDPDVADSTSALLALHGYRVRTAHGGDEAARLATEAPPDLVLSDLLMPGVDGFELARRVRALSRGRPPVLVAVTARGAQGDVEQGRAAGFHLHLLKPVDPAVLVGVVARVERLVTGLTDEPSARLPES